MSRARRLIFTLAALTLCTAACAGSRFPDPRTMAFPPLSFSPPVPKRVTTANGTVLHFLPDDEVPLVDIKVLVRTGSVFDPGEKAGLADMAGRLLRTGGTAAYSSRRLSERLEEMGAVLETRIGRESGSASLSVLSGDLDEGLALLAQVLRAPLFDRSEVERVRNRMLEELRRSEDDPDEIAFRELRAAVYGEDPRGRTPARETLLAVERDDLSAFHRRFFHPDRLIVGVSGDFSEEQLLSSWLRHFGDWAPAGGPAEPMPLPAGSPQAAVHLVDKAFPQASILIGGFAPPLDSRDYHAFTVLNYILGGAGFNSRLTEEIRSNRGLAYSVGSSYRGDVGYGILVAYCRTGPETAVEAALLMRDIMEQTAAGGVRDDELTWARDSIVNGLIFSLKDPAEIVSRHISLEYDGLPGDFLERLPQRIGAVTLEDVAAAARRHLQPRSGAVVIVGDAGRFQGDPGRLGEVLNTPLRR